LLIIKGNKCYVEDIPKEHKLTQILQIGEWIWCFSLQLESICRIIIKRKAAMNYEK
jgi:hypothetical protein